MMTVAEILQFVPLFIKGIEALPELAKSIGDVINLIRNHGELSPEQKTALIADLDAIAAKVAAYQPRPVPA